ILNFVNFNNHVNARKGAHYDAYYMTLLLHQLGYKVINCDEKLMRSKDQVKQILQIFIEKCNADDVSSFLVYVGSHGGKDIIHLPGGVELHLFSDIIYQFSSQRCPKLNKKPKIFIVQACRMFEKTDEPEYNNIDNAIVVYATLPGNPA